MQRALFYTKHTEKFTPAKHNLLVFQVKTNTARDATSSDTCNISAKVACECC